jgi:hypothetical protein
MGKYDSQRAAYEFLLRHLLSGEAFVLKEFLTVTGWTTPGTYRTYLTKQYRGLIEKTLRAVCSESMLTANIESLNRFED